MDQKEERFRQQDLVIGVIGLVLGFVIGVVGTAISYKQLRLQQQEAVAASEQRAKDAEQRLEDRTPNLKWVGHDHEDGDVIITLKNTAAQAVAALREVRFVVTAPEQLQAIARRYPRPSGAENKVGADNTEDAILIKSGRWLGPDAYEFYETVRNHVQPGQLNDFRFRIIRPGFSGEMLLGEITIEYDGQATVRAKDMTIRAESTYPPEGR